MLTQGVTDTHPGVLFWGGKGVRLEGGGDDFFSCLTDKHV